MGLGVDELLVVVGDGPALHPVEALRHAIDLELGRPDEEKVEPRERRRVERHLGRAVDRRLDLGDEVELGLRLIELPREDLALDLPLQHLLRPLP